MPDFAVTWNIDAITADTPENAARQAWQHMRRPDSTANVFDVADEKGAVTRIDLQGLDAHQPENDPKEYRLRIGVTVRAFAEERFEAETWDEALAKARAVNPRDFLYRYDHDDIEGDEIGYLSEADDDDEAEIDLRGGNEGPFSWHACEFVKDIAKVDPKLSPPEMFKLMQVFIERAHKACTKED